MSKLTMQQIEKLFADAEPLCSGDTSNLLDWIIAGNDSADITHYSAQDIADEWNEYTADAE